MKVTWVPPFKQSIDNNKSLIAGLKDYHPVEYPEPIQPRFQLPIFGDVDVNSLMRENESMRPAVATDLADGLASAGAIETQIAKDDEHPPELMVTVDDMVPRNRQHQLATVLFQNCPSLSNNAMEKVLVLISLLLSKERSVAQWCRISDHDLANVNGVFVRFSSVAAVRTLRRHWDTLRTVFDVELVAGVPLDNEEAKESPIDDARLQKIRTEIAGIIANKNNRGKTASRSGTEDLDEVMQYYRTYRVENSELVEVPKELKAKIVKEIIRFRSKVLSIERDARKREIELETRKAKARITQIYQGIKESSSGPQSVSSDGALDEAAENAALEEQKLDDSKTDDPIDTMTNEEYEKYLKEKEALHLKSVYDQKIEKMHSLEKFEKASLLAQLNSAASYEDNLIDNKLSYLEDYKQFVDFEVTSRNPVLSSNLRLYYNNHSEYLRIRNIQRSAEEEKDKADEEEEAQQQRELPTAPSVPTQAKTHEVDTSGVDGIVISKLSSEVQTKIHDRIGELIEEYLGIKEDVLIDFINDFILENNLSKKDTLIAELQETLDEDSNNVVNSLYECIHSQCRANQ